MRAVTMAAAAAALVLATGPCPAHEDASRAADPPTTAGRASQPGRNDWNRGREPKDWWGEIENRHGHVGPWNVLGYRIGRAILRETGAGWGDHSVVVVSHIPERMPYSCLIDGLAVATGNSEGRLDLMMSGVASPEFLHVSARRRSDGRVLVFKPRAGVLAEFAQGTEADMARQSARCRDAAEADLFELVTLPLPPR